MTNNVYLDKEAYEILMLGVDKVANAVKSTLGGNGRNVVIQGTSRYPHITKDGVTVAASISLDDPKERLGASLIKEVADKTLETSGDGPQPLSSKILTPNGWVKMGDIKVGQQICGTGGSVQKVLGVYPKGKKEVYELALSDGSVTECCLDHYWNVTTSQGKEKTLQLKDMINDYAKKGPDNSVLSKYYIPSTFAEFNESEGFIIDPYFLGLLIGDGSLSGTGAIELSLGKNKEHVLDKIVLPEGVEMRSTWVDKKNYFRVKFTGVSNKKSLMYKHLDKLGLLGSKSKTKFIPTQYLYSSGDTRKKLLQGLLDTDGYINSKGLFEFSTSSEQLFNDFVELCNSLGIPLNKRVVTNRGKNAYSNTPIYRVNELKGYKYGRKVVGIRPTNRTEEVQCIKVSNSDELYITDDYIVTHNTTTATVVAQNVMKLALEEIKKGENAINIKKSIQKDLDTLLDELTKLSRTCDDLDSLEKIATVSANNDKHIGGLIKEAMTEVGADGLIKVEMSNTNKTYVDVINGMRLESGYITPHLVTDNSKMVCELENPFVLVSVDAIDTVAPLMDVLEFCNESNKPLLIIASEVKGEALKTLIVNHMKGALKVCIVKAPKYGSQREEFLGDVASFVGATLINERIGDSISDLNRTFLGKCASISVNKNTTTLAKGAGDITERLNSIEGDDEWAAERRACLASKMAVLNIGGFSESEIKEKKDRIDDALRATVGAHKHGYVFGGGTALWFASNKLPNGILKEAVKQPSRQILDNAGIDPLLLERLETYGIGVNVLNGEVEDFSDIIDPLNVVKNAVVNAVSVANTFLTTKCLIINDK